MAIRRASLTSATPRGRRPAAAGAVRCRRKFLRFFPGGFRDETYLEWERDYKWAAHEQWEARLGETEFTALLAAGEHAEIAQRAVRIESRTNLLFSFEKMALRDAVRTPAGAARFAQGLFDLLHAEGALAERFQAWCEVVAALPRRQTRVLTWPLATVFGFIAQPARHFFLKPMVTRAAAREYGIDFGYVSRPDAEAYERLLGFARIVRRDLHDLRPRDMIDIQSFLWVQGSDEYEE
ncbi:MAG TPA: hypothetical protein VFU00_08420 [Gemmatimonadales bacterium]|nr:hypothetical protein [Gemmatimonadales bacterium]